MRWSEKRSIFHRKYCKNFDKTEVGTYLHINPSHQNHEPYFSHLNTTEKSTEFFLHQDGLALILKAAIDEEEGIGKIELDFSLTIGIHFNENSSTRGCMYL